MKVLGRNKSITEGNLTLANVRQIYLSLLTDVRLALSGCLVASIATLANVSQSLWKNAMPRRCCQSSNSSSYQGPLFYLINWLLIITSHLVQRVTSTRLSTIRCTSLILLHIHTHRISRICGCVSRERRSNKWASTGLSSLLT
jgi:hypothetical protein